MADHRILHDPAGFHILDERAQKGGGLRAAGFRHAHRLADHHEALAKQSNVKIEAILQQTPVSVPFDVNITFLGWQFLDKVLDDMSDAEARDRLRKLGIECPDLTTLLQPSK